MLGIFLRGNLLIKCPEMFTGPVGPVEVLFYWPKAIFGKFYWPRAIGPLLVSSPDVCTFDLLICSIPTGDNG